MHQKVDLEHVTSYSKKRLKKNLISKIIKIYLT